MEEIYEISKYFPYKVAEPDLSKYINHHLNHLFKCVENGLYSSAYSHLHILYMVFVYIQILRISQKDKEKKEEARRQGKIIKTEFELCWIGFPSEEKDFLENPSSPFSFSKINEKTVFRFFRLIDFDDGTISNLSEPVVKRNKSFHASGKILFESLEDFEDEANNYFQKMKNIILKQNVFLKNIYFSLIKNYKLGYQITSDDIEIDFSIPYFFSEYELKFLAKRRKDIVSKYILENL